MCCWKKLYVFDEHNKHRASSRQRPRLFLFARYINDILQCSNFEPILYNDDAVMTSSDSKLNSLKKKAETEFDKILTWFNCNKLCINLSKTQYMLFSRRKKTRNFCVNINNTILLPKPSVKYLEVQIDQNLTWEGHITHCWKPNTKCPAERTRPSLSKTHNPELKSNVSLLYIFRNQNRDEQQRNKNERGKESKNYSKFSKLN